jgi:DNA-binding CsgD family transcriptional regulator
MDTKRAAVVDDIATYLRDGISVNLSGMSQSGRTYVAQEVMRKLRLANLAAVPIVGNSLLRDRALAALALANVEGAPPQGTSHVVAATNELVARITARPSFLVIDDGDDIDEVSAGIVLAAHRRTQVAVLIVTRPEELLGAPDTELTSGAQLSRALQPGVRIALSPLDFGQTNRLLHDELRAPVDPGVVSAIGQMSGGLPGLVRAIADSGRRTGALVRKNGIWQLHRELWDPRLHAAVVPLLKDLDSEDLTVLAKIAATGGVIRDAAEQIASPEVLARLSLRGLLRTADPNGTPFVGLYPSALVEYFNQTTGKPDQTVTYVVERHTTQTRADQVAACRAAWEADPTPRQAVPLFGALAAANAPSEEFDDVFARTDAAGPTGRIALSFALWRANYLALVKDDVTTAKVLLDEAERTYPDGTNSVRAARGVVDLYTGRCPDPDDYLPAVGRGSGGHSIGGQDAVGQEELAAVRIAALIAVGRTADAQEEMAGLSGAMDLMDGSFRVREPLAYLLHGRPHHGDIAHGIDRAQALLADAEAEGDLTAMQEYAYEAALGLSVTGRFAELDELLSRALALGHTAAGREHYQVGILSLASLTATWLGDEKYGLALAVQAAAVGRSPGPFPGMTFGLVPVPADDAEPERASRGDLPERLWAAVNERLESGYIAAGVMLALTATAMAPNRHHADTVLRHAEGTQSPFLQAIGRYVAAEAASDTDALAGALTTFSAMGAAVYAVRASIGRAVALRLAGDIDASNAQADDAWALATALPRVPVGMFLRLRDTVGLSPRESEVALMAAGGMDSRSIAADLTLSLRTVENAMSAINRKLGAGGRADLARAVTTWARLSAE